MTNNDQYLIQECLAGRTEAFDQLVLKYQDRLFRTLVRVLGSSDDARDAAQEVAELAERKKLVHQALNELQEEYRTPLILRELEGMSYGEIAEITEIPLGTVRSRIFRGRNELKQKLNTLFQDAPVTRVSESDHESSISESK